MGTVNRAPFAEPLWHSRKASPYYLNSHHRLQKEVRQYVNAKILPFSEAWERQGSVPKEVRVSLSPQSALLLKSPGGARFLLSIADEVSWPPRFIPCQKITFKDCVSRET